VYRETPGSSPELRLSIVILSEASRSFIARGAVEEPVLSLSKEPAVLFVACGPVFAAVRGGISAAAEMANLKRRYD
jgi:hypothetical protein